MMLAKMPAKMRRKGMSDLLSADTSKTCENSPCDRTFILTLAAPHKRFCSQDCRIAWHNKRRQAAEEALEEKLAALACPQHRNE